jgi:hypothetical protein
MVVQRILIALSPLSGAQLAPEGLFSITSTAVWFEAKKDAALMQS